MLDLRTSTLNVDMDMTKCGGMHPQSESRLPKSGRDTQGIIYKEICVVCVWGGGGYGYGYGTHSIIASE
jgi:hypothetical protein